MQTGHDAHVCLVTSERHQHTHTFCHFTLHGLWYSIGKETVERHRQYDISVSDYYILLLTINDADGVLTRGLPKNHQRPCSWDCVTSLPSRSSLPCL